MASAHVQRWPAMKNDWKMETNIPGIIIGLIVVLSPSLPTNVFMIIIGVHSLSVKFR